MCDFAGADPLQAVALPFSNAGETQYPRHRKRGSERFRWSRMRSMISDSNENLYMAEPSYSKGEWIVPSGYNYGAPTHENYAARPEDRNECFGQYQDVRRSRDFDYHGTYSRERQLFQDSLVKNVVGASFSKEHPWIVFTAGAMGAGKSYTINWMSQMGFFPLPDIVTIDPDLFKTSFPEWPQYLKHCPETAGSLTRKESGYLVEIAQEIALNQMKNLWVDGSLRDSQWYEGVFEDIRKNHPSYRIAILYVYASDELVLERARRRAEETGRVVPEADIKDSLYRVPRTVAILTPKTDFVAHIENEGDQPRMTGFSDWNGCHRNVLGGWTEVKNRFATLPEFSERCRWTAIVERNISMPGVLVYSKTYCSFCAKLKGLLRQLRIPFRVEELDKMQGGAAMQLALAARPSSRCHTVPQLFAAGEFIGGCSDALVLHAQGKLELILRKAASEALPEGEKGLYSPVGSPGSSSRPGEIVRPKLNRSLSA